MKDKLNKRISVCVSEDTEYMIDYALTKLMTTKSDFIRELIQYGLEKQYHYLKDIGSIDNCPFCIKQK